MAVPMPMSTPTAPAPARDVIRVVLVAHHALVGEAVGTALASRRVAVVHLPRASTQRELAEVRRRLVSLRPDAGLVLRDIGDPVQLRDTVRLVQAVPMRWLLLTSSVDDVRWGAAVQAGVRAVMTMSEGIDEVERVLREVAAGRPGISAQRRQQVVQAWQLAGDQHRELVERMGELTPREMTVLGLLAGGLPVKRIAERLQVAEGTVRSQVKSLLRKLGVNSQLAAVAAHRQVVRLHDPTLSEPPPVVDPEL
jgi:two-component system, NarL family, nitrate/nitrite response regulator NarL